MWEPSSLVDLSALPGWAWALVVVASLAAELSAVLVIRCAVRRFRDRRRHQDR